MKAQPARQTAPPWCGIWHDVRVTGFLIEMDGSAAPADRETVQRLLTDGFFPVLSSFDDRIDQLQDEIFAKPTDEQMSELF